MKNLLKKILHENILKEARKLPSIEDIYSCPSIYKMIKFTDLESFIELGFQRVLSGGNGEMYGEGVYSSLFMAGRYGATRLTRYGHTMLQCKVINGFKNYLFFDTDRYSVLRNLMIQYYGRPLSIEEQIYSICGDRKLSHYLARYGSDVNNIKIVGDDVVNKLRIAGVRGMMYDYCGGPTVLPIDFSSVIIVGYANDIYYNTSENEIKNRMAYTLDTEAIKRYEIGNDWAFQLTGRFDEFDKEKAIRVTTNKELYCMVRDYAKGYNIVQVDTTNEVNPNPKVVSDIWFKQKPTMPLISNGIFDFYYKGFIWHATVYLPSDKIPALWYPGNINAINSPNIERKNDWVELNQSTLDEVVDDYKSQLSQNANTIVSESLQKIFRKCLKEEIDSNISEEDFLSKNRTYIYRATNRSTIKSIFENGQLRQFCGSNDGSWYGEGVYAVCTRNVYYDKYDEEAHSSGIKMIVLDGFKRFLIFEEHIAKRVYGENYRIENQINLLFPQDVANDILKDFSTWMRGDNREWEKNKIQVRHTAKGDIHPSFPRDCRQTMYGNRTTGILHAIFDNSYFTKKYTNLFSKYNIRGAVYIGGNDGLSCVCWAIDQAIPYEYTLDRGKTWNKDLFNFENIKQRSIRNNDPVNKFRHLYLEVSDRIYNCTIMPDSNKPKFTPIKRNVTTVKMKDGGYNIIDINKPPETQLLSKYNFDEKPGISPRGFFDFKYHGKEFIGIVCLPSENIPAFWFPEDLRKINYPNIYDSNGWVGFDDLDEAANSI